MSRLADVMCLSDSGECNLCVRIQSKVYRENESIYPGFTIDKQNNATFYLPESADKAAFATQGMNLMQVIGRFTETQGGMLIHGALAASGDRGIILTGPSGSGKSTVSRRLKSPWRSLCDDLTLIVQDARGIYWAHPLPTWSEYMPGGSGGSWDVQETVQLQGIYFLEKSLENTAGKIGTGESLCMLQECMSQVARIMERGLKLETIRRLRLRRFDNACHLAKSVPGYVLRISRDCALKEILNPE